MSKEIILDEGMLRKLYLKDNLSQKKIADYFKCSVDVVAKCLKKYGIQKPRYKDLRGKTFGRLTVLEKAEDRITQKGYKRIMWHCRCVCGNECDVASDALSGGKTSSCGCLINQDKKKYNTYDLSGDYGVGYTSKGEEFYFDLEDYEKIRKYCWSINSEGYVSSRDTTTGKSVRMHQIIMQNKLIDHKDHRKNDNRKSKLRLCTDALNSRNRTTPNNNTSGCKGVRWHSRDKVWEAYITCDKKWRYIGRFEKYEDAVAARKAEEEKLFGDWSYDNSMK